MSKFPVHSCHARIWQRGKHFPGFATPRFPQFFSPNHQVDPFATHFTMSSFAEVPMALAGPEKTRELSTAVAASRPKTVLTTIADRSPDVSADISPDTEPVTDYIEDADERCLFFGEFQQ